jgi:hypothetical protein
MSVPGTYKRTDKIDRAVGSPDLGKVMLVAKDGHRRDLLKPLIVVQVLANNRNSPRRSTFITAAQERHDYRVCTRIRIIFHTATASISGATHRLPNPPEH